VGKYPGLKLRGATYRLRVRVPPDLLEAYAPKKEIWRSLRTKSHNEAVRQYRVELVKLDQEFELAQARLLEQPKTSLSDTDLQRIKALYIHGTLASDDTFREEGSGEASLVESIARQLEDCGVEFRLRTH